MGIEETKQAYREDVVFIVFLKKYCNFCGILELLPLVGLIPIPIFP